jgi:hypothetical protein
MGGSSSIHHVSKNDERSTIDVSMVKDRWCRCINEEITSLSILVVSEEEEIFSLTCSISTREVRCSPLHYVSTKKERTRRHCVSMGQSDINKML